jgi:hypothetical protein
LTLARRKQIMALQDRRADMRQRHTPYDPNLFRLGFDRVRAFGKQGDRQTNLSAECR